jgi:hypothetical protein
MKQTYTLTLSLADGELSVLHVVKNPPVLTLADTLDDNPIRATIEARERGAELLACEAHSFVGDLIADLFNDVAKLLNRENLELSTIDSIIDAAVDQAFVWYFG